MASLSYTHCDPPECNARRRKPKKNNFDAVPCQFQILEPLHVRQPTQRAFKGEVLPSMRETIQFFQHEPSRRSSGQVGIERRKAACNEVCVYKVNHTCFLREKFFCKGGLTRTIGSRDHNATRGFHGLLFHFSITKTRGPSSWHSKSSRLSVFGAEKESLTPLTLPSPPGARVRAAKRICAATPFVPCHVGVYNSF